MTKATYIGAVPLDFLKMPKELAPWEKYQTDDIFATNFISYPSNYMLTLGSAIPHDYSYTNLFSSLATTPSYQLPTSTQIYVAGRDVIRWGGKNDPLEIDFDRYVFTPDINKKIAYVSKAPKSEPHHLSDVPELINQVPKDWQQLFKAIKDGEFS